MKSSAWYHKLWQKKVNQYPIRDDADASWADMKTMLEEHLPADIPLNKIKSARSIGGTAISILGFALSAAAMIGLVTFIAVKHPAKNKLKTKHPQDQSAQKAVATTAIYNDSINTKTDTPAGKTYIDTNKKKGLMASTGGNTGNYTRAVSNTPSSNKNTVAGYSALTAPGTGNRISAIDAIIPTPGIAAVNHLLNTDRSVLPLTGAGYIINTGSIKSENARGSSKIIVNKVRPSKNNKVKKPKGTPGNSLFDFSAEAALNTSGAGTNALFGLWAGYPLSPKWQLNGGIRVDINRTLSGTIVHPSYSRPDTIVFKVADSRKLNVISVPVTLEYRVSNVVSIHAGPQISFSAGQSQHTNKVGNVPRYTDTLSHSQSIDSALKYNSINKVTVGLTGGISFKVKRFTIEGLYQQNITPYNIATGLGNYKQFYHSFQVGIRYAFKKK